MRLLPSALVALLASLASLFFSEVMEFIPCSLCWYQRIFMYPLVYLYFYAYILNDIKIFKYTRPIIISGFVVALYHNLLVWEVIPESLSPCVQGIPCSAVYLNWLGFITIPFMSCLAFAILLMMSFVKIEPQSKV